MSHHDLELDELKASHSKLEADYVELRKQKAIGDAEAIRYRRTISSLREETDSLKAEIEVLKKALVSSQKACVAGQSQPPLTFEEVLERMKELAQEENGSSSKRKRSNSSLMSVESISDNGDPSGLESSALIESQVGTDGIEDHNGTNILSAESISDSGDPSGLESSAPLESQVGTEGEEAGNGTNNVQTINGNRHTMHVDSTPSKEARQNIPSPAIASTSANLDVPTLASADPMQISAGTSSQQNVETPKEKLLICLNCFKPSSKRYCSHCKPWIHYTCITSELATRFSTPADGDFCFYCKQLGSLQSRHSEPAGEPEPEIGAFFNVDLLSTRTYGKPNDINGGQLLWKTVAGVDYLVGDFVEYKTNYDLEGICQIISIVLNDDDKKIYIHGKLFYTQTPDRPPTQVVLSDDGGRSFIILNRHEIYRKLHVLNQHQYDCGVKVVNISHKLHYWCNDSYSEEGEYYTPVEECSFYPRNNFFFETVPVSLDLNITPS